MHLHHEIGHPAGHLGYNGVGSDLYTAAKSAGITLPKIYSIATLPTGVQAAQEGELTATVPVDYNDLGWRDADALARIFTGLWDGQEWDDRESVS